jgi:Tol biopolymer transport system component
MRGESDRLRIGWRGTALVGLTLGASFVALVLLQPRVASGGGTPRDTKIVFDRFIANGPPLNYDVFVMDPDGSHRQRLTRDPAYDWAPAVSPSGRRIVFGSDRDGDDEIFKMRADGSGEHRLTANDDSDSEPSYSPNGRRIVFESNRDGDSEIFKMRADGSRQRRLTRNTDNDYDPAYSPSGTRIAFVSNRDGDDEIFVMRANGSNEHKLTRNNVLEEFPNWGRLPR